MDFNKKTWENGEGNPDALLNDDTMNDFEARIDTGFTDLADEATASILDEATARAAADAALQPLDSDLTAIAALSTTAFGRALLALADAAAGRTALGLGTASTHATGDYDAAGAAAAAQAASQPLDSDLTAIAALSSTAFGRALLELADASAGRTALGLGSAATHATGDYDAAGAATAAAAAAAAALATHEADTTSIHGVTDTSLLVTRANLAKGVFAVERNGALNIAAAGTEVIWDQEVFDPDGWHDTATGRYTPQEPGYYRFSWHLRLTLATAKHVFSALAKNAGLVGRGSYGTALTGAVTPSTCGSAICHLNGSTDYVSVFGAHTDTGSKALSVGAGEAYFHGERIARD